MRMRTVLYGAFLFFGSNTIFNLNAAASTGIYQTPPVLYVGDRGSLVYQLDAFTPIPESDTVFPDGISKSDDIIIHKIEIDRRGRRVIIEFQAFRTGTTRLPPIPFGDRELKGLQVNVASILDSEKGVMTLSPSAGLIVAPGTFWIITAFFAAIIIALLAVVLLYAKGSAFFCNMRNTLRERLLLHWINAWLRRMENRFRLGRIPEKEALSSLSNGIRVFLSRFWMQPCYAMSAEEFLNLRIPGITDSVELMTELCAFFKRCDEIRFGCAEFGAEAGESESPDMKDTVGRKTISLIYAEAKILVNGKITAAGAPPKKRKRGAFSGKH
jgi:hypothetical protein